MAADLIPQNHEAFRTKFTQFRDWLNINGAAFGFSIGEIAAVSTARDDQNTKLIDKQAKDTAALISNEALGDSESAGSVLWRSSAKRLQAHPNMTDPIREAAAITVPDRIRTDRVAGVEVPGVEVKLGVGVVTIHWGTNPTNEALNGKPVWADGANIYLSVDGGPQFLAGFDRASPFRYLVTGPPVSLTIQVAYRAPEEDEVGTKSAPQTVSTGG